MKIVAPLLAWLTLLPQIASNCAAVVGQGLGPITSKGIALVRIGQEHTI